MKNVPLWRVKLIFDFKLEHKIGIYENWSIGTYIQYNIIRNKRWIRQDFIEWYKSYGYATVRLHPVRTRTVTGLFCEYYARVDAQGKRYAVLRTVNVPWKTKVVIYGVHSQNKSRTLNLAKLVQGSSLNICQRV